MLFTNKYVKNINGEAVTIIIIIYYWCFIIQTKQHDKPNSGIHFISTTVPMCDRKSTGLIELSFCSLRGFDTNHLRWISLLNG